MIGQTRKTTELELFDDISNFVRDKQNGAMDGKGERAGGGGVRPYILPHAVTEYSHFTAAQPMFIAKELF